MDFDRSVSKLKKEQEKRRAEAVRKAERYVAFVSVCVGGWVHASPPPVTFPSLCPTFLYHAVLPPSTRTPSSLSSVLLRLLYFCFPSA